jgi:hypothetical protein
VIAPAVLEGVVAHAAAHGCRGAGRHVRLVSGVARMFVIGGRVRLDVLL